MDETPSPIERHADASEAERRSAALGSETAFIRCIERLEEMIEAETRILKSCARVDFEALNLRKTHALLEFTRVARNAPPQASELSSRKLARLRERLAVNTEALEQHLLAMQEIASLVVACIRNDDSDGTYSRKGATRR
jgi:hypothetical protein